MSVSIALALARVKTLKGQRSESRAAMRAYLGKMRDSDAFGIEQLAEMIETIYQPNGNNIHSFTSKGSYVTSDAKALDSSFHRRQDLIQPSITSASERDSYYFIFSADLQLLGVHRS